MVRWRRLALALVAVVLGGCATLRSDYPRTPSSSLPAQFDGASGRYLQSEVESHPGKSGFRLLTRGTDALMSRVWLIDHARHSIDLQYFIFLNDSTGRLVAQRLLAAADRGVRVRLLLDDISLEHEDRLLGALSAHPHVEVRVFNPFRTRDPSWPSKIAQLALEAPRLNRRMHNKSMVVDGMVAVLGGRNIADAYFDADGSNSNFRDLDVLTIGPVVGEAAQAFDAYWNSNSAYPLEAYRLTRDAHQDLATVRPELAGSVRAFAQSDYAQAVLEELPNGATGARPGRWLWGDGTLLVDQPQKVELRHDEPALRIGPQVKQAMDGAGSELILISPYFLPSKPGVRYLTALARRGVKVRVLTNSLASTDDPVAEAPYARERRALLEGGVELYELQPSGGPRQRHERRSSSGVSLHAKAIVIDRRFVFVGSMNLDPRSKLLNTEMGVLADCPDLAGEVAGYFERGADPQHAYHVELEKHAAPSASGGRLTWSWDDHGTPLTTQHEPQVSAARRVEFDLARLLPIDGML
jgi:cardiolipin synthase C